MTMRRLSDSSRPIVGYLLALLILFVFIGVSILLLSSKYVYAPYVYAFASLFFVSKLNDIRRNDFLKFCFTKAQYRTVRILENLIVALPFILFLLCKHHFYLTLILTAVTISMALLNFKTTYNVTIPTPFYKKPFEFTVGFRNTFFMFLISYGLTIVAINVNNFNLGIFALGLIFFTILGYYLKPENEYFIWIYNCTPAKFLFKKIKTAVLFSFCLSMPVLILLSIAYFEHIGILLALTLLGFVYLTTFILAKYSAYPEEIGIMQGIILAFGLFPPMLIVIIPLFAGKSVNQLKEILK